MIYDLAVVRAVHEPDDLHVVLVAHGLDDLIEALAVHDLDDLCADLYFRDEVCHREIFLRAFR